MPYWLVMPAAGASRRFGASLPKQYAPLAGRTVIEHALSSFVSDPRCRGIVVAAAGGDARWPAIAASLPNLETVIGGEQRFQSVRNALMALSKRADDRDWVAVHDAARPCLTPALRDRVVAAAAAHPVGALLAVRVADTLKHAAGGEVQATIDRSELWAAQTPQVFRYGELSAALDAAHWQGRIPTDEAQAMEWVGLRPVLVEGSPENLKITAAAQLRLAEAILAGASRCV